MAKKRSEPQHNLSTPVGVIGILFSAVGWPPVIAAVILVVTVALCVGIAKLEEQLG